MDDEFEGENIAATLSKVLPKPEVVTTLAAGDRDSSVVQVLALPPGWCSEELDDEKYLHTPRRTKSQATLFDAPSFLDFVQRYRDDRTIVWCEFNPQTFALSFRAVIDDHTADNPGWRAHQGYYKPEPSAEWKVWSGSNKKSFEQVPFAEFIEANEDDIRPVSPGMPSTNEMLKMATDFIAHGEMKVKSKVTLQSGGVALEYINETDGETLDRMKLFEKFSIGIPVFWRAPAAPGETVPAFPVVARLRFRIAQGKVTFYYEMIRPDLVYQRAALELIEEIKGGIDNVPLILGTSN